MSDLISIFDRAAVRRNRDRAARDFENNAFLFDEVGERLADRLDDIKRRFPLALDLGCRNGQVKRLIGGRGGIERWIECDLSEAMVRQAGSRSGSQVLAADEEYLPFGNATFDLIISNLSLHWVNDLPGALVQIRKALKLDGLFLASMFGGETLKELRQAFSQAEVDTEGGISPRVSPFADVRDAGNLLQRAGFALPVGDMDSISVSYAEPFKLMADLRNMGEANAVVERRKCPTRRRTLMAAAAAYQDMFGGDDGRVPATFQVIYLTAWAPHPSQQKPLRPGSASHRLADALGTTVSKEIPE